MNDYQGALGQRFARGADVRPGIRNRRNPSLRPGPETVVPVTRPIDEMLAALLPSGPVEVSRMTTAELTEFQQRENDRILTLSELVRRQAEIATRPLPAPNMGGKKVKKGADDED